MRILRKLSRVIARFNERIGPTLAAEGSVRDAGGMGGTHVDPLALSILQAELEDPDDESAR